MEAGDKQQEMMAEKPGETPEAPIQKRKKDFFKQKVALFFGYNGTTYKGLQKQK
jgi:hypothetical protein